jgi:hypothetical protein
MPQKSCGNKLRGGLPGMEASMPFILTVLHVAYHVWFVVTQLLVYPGACEYDR